MNRPRKGVDMSIEDNKALVRRWFEDVDKGNPAIIEENLPADYADHDPPPFQTAPGLDGARAAFEYALRAFGEFQHVIDDQIAEGDLVVTRVTGSGKHTGEFMGVPPTGKDVVMTGISVHRIADGKIVEHWAAVDALGLLIQMGAIPMPG
jgi:predicted ester cyclase